MVIIFSDIFFILFLKFLIMKVIYFYVYALYFILRFHIIRNLFEKHIVFPQKLAITRKKLLQILFDLYCAQNYTFSRTKGNENVF